MKNLPSDFLLATTLRAIGDGVISCDRDGSVVMINAVAAALTGWGEQEAIGARLKDVFRIINETTRETTEDPVDKVLRLGRTVGLANHTLLLRRDGTELAIDDSAAPIYDEGGTLRGVVLVFRDVTERRHAEWNLEMLAGSGRVLGEARETAVILERIGEVVSEHFADFCVFDVMREDGEFERTVGRHRVAEMQGVADRLKGFRKGPMSAGHPVRRVLETRKTQLRAVVDEAALADFTVSAEHGRYLRDELAPRSVISVALCAGEEDLGVVTFFRHRMATPFTELDGKAAEELGERVGLAMYYARLRGELTKARQVAERSRERLQTMMDRASVGIVIGDFDGRLSYANDMLLGWVGYERADLERGAVRWDVLSAPEFAEQDAYALQELRERGYATPYEKVYLAKDGRRVPMLVGAAAIPAVEKGGADEIAGYFNNLTLQKRAEAALVQTEKLTAVGRLASSISHEINNPLEAVTNLLYIVRSSPNLSQTDRDYLAAADRELTRVAQITSQTLRFHRQTTSATKIRPESLLEEVLGLYGTRLAGSQIEVVPEYGVGVEFTCFEGDIRQVLSNLVGNAFDAMRTGGRLRLRTQKATWWSTGQAGVMMTIADDGTGMPKEVQQHIFEAFYSTKGIHGTGLGLWISKRIVHKHRGHLRVKSSTGAMHGTVFSLWLPVELAATAQEAWHGEE